MTNPHMSGTLLYVLGTTPPAKLKEELSTGILAKYPPPPSKT